jgi:hypothetical protein
MKCSYSVSCSKAEKEIDLLKDGGKIKKGKNIEHHIRELFRTFATFQGPSLERSLAYIGNVFREFSRTETSSVKLIISRNLFTFFFL